MPKGFALVSLHDVTPAYGDLVVKAINEIGSWALVLWPFLWSRISGTGGP